MEEKLGEIGKQFKIPIILGLVGAIFLITSVLLLSKREKASSVTFLEKSATTSSGLVVVDIAGSVENPGVYQMEVGSRIGDLIIAAGGLSSSAHREWIAKNVNQAARLIDGTKVYIPSVDEPIEELVQGQNDVLGVSYDTVININLASESELDTLPGVGPVTANKIIANRPYQRIEELKDRKVVGQATFEKIKDLIVVY